MRCHACGARNSDDATWCTQCYVDVTGDPDSTPGSSGAAAGTTGAAAPSGEAADLADGSVASRPRPAGSPGPEREVRERDGEVEWRCGACGGWSALVRESCSTCEAPRRGFGEPARSRPARTVNETAVVGASLLLPGLGHLLVGRYSSGIARAMLALLWLFGGLTLASGNTGVRAVPGWWLLISAFGLWAATAADAWSVASGSEKQLLSAARLGWLVLVVTVGLVMSAAMVMLTRS